MTDQAKGEAETNGPQWKELPEQWQRWKPIAVLVFAGADYLVSNLIAPLPLQDALSTAAFAKILVPVAGGFCVVTIVDLHLKSKWSDKTRWRVTFAAVALSLLLYASYTFWALPKWTSACGTRAPLNDKVMVIGWTFTPLGQEAWNKAQEVLRVEPTMPQVIEGAYWYRENLWPQGQRRLRSFILHALYIATPVSFAVASVLVLIALYLAFPAAPASRPSDA